MEHKKREPSIPMAALRLTNISFLFGTAIDVVLGGPPCVDFSLVNARREGIEGEQGRYMLQFGRMIRSIERSQRSIERSQQPHPLFFLAENVFLRGDDLQAAREAFAFDW